MRAKNAFGEAFNQALVPEAAHIAVGKPSRIQKRAVWLFWWNQSHQTERKDSDRLHAGIVVVYTAAG
jgi:hypothetical protein